MKRYNFCNTKDGSVGLYNNEIKDIYHSSYGALRESIQKFILPSGYIDFVKDKKSVKILDICFGIGYNTKSALYFGKQINKKIKLTVDALEMDEELVFISPFVRDTIPSFDLKLFLIDQLSKNSIQFTEAVNKILSEVETQFKPFYDQHITNFYKNNNIFPYKVSQRGLDDAFLHNIYYQYISNSIKNGLRNSFFRDCHFNYHSGDARVALNNIDTTYDFIFLDAFTPQKDPTLWTYDFVKLIKSKMNQNSILITYSNSTPFRAALLDLNFNVGKVIVNNRELGTIASLDKNRINYPLDDYDIGLTQTTGGIFYRDKKLSLSRDEIIFNREAEKSKSDRIKISRYKKDFIRTND